MKVDARERRLVPEVGIALEDRGRKADGRETEAGLRQPRFAKQSVVPEVGIEPTRGVNPTGF